MFNVVLVNPEIPPNTGNIGRMCIGTSTKLHLIKPLGFSMDDKHLKRAGLDYWKDLNLETHESFDCFLKAYPHAVNNAWFATKKAEKYYTDVSYSDGDFLVFGRESVGLSPQMLTNYNDRLISIPISGPIRSYNLSNSVAVILMEALRQTSAVL